ncbi:tRNA (adenosine(37)-N6)-threonylcarbamoyltransferase complex ATPase subunit type 1 TsaE [Megasphaera elsdenii]|uniref:tRNA (adenosine(37)-N6)-threonylcarbamoyltransferase complex ATPase subunit type 1 TsaE n=1 Tax=Megasphaera elsdenii TaxID=907 RepID=UPI00242E68F3|nr:tRNA (adenosine(37)-N6)-threonylcarbamoyltransferase complex ATPase subunit type 1 TsaE [Megasphaera elsdenii]
MTFDVATHSEAGTIALGKALGPVLSDGDVLALRGDLGAGKTHFVQGIAQGMGIDDVVVSPTFTILNYYENTIPLQHFDFYRLEEEYELDDLGFDDYLESGVTVIEWSEKFPDRLPDDAAIVTIEKTSPTDRLFHFDFRGSCWKAVENEVKKYALSH